MRLCRYIASFGILSIVSVCGFAKNPTQPNASAAEPQKNDGLTGSGGLSQSSVHMKNTVGFWLSLRNRDSRPIQAVRIIYIEPSGYELVRVCWLDATALGCHATSNGAVALQSPIEAGQSITIWGDIRATDRHEKGKLISVIAWTDAKGTSSELAIPMGEIVAEDWCERFGKRLYDLVKEFALPLVLVLLGVAYQYWDKKRELLRQAAEKTKESERREQDQKRDQILQTWNSMLPTSHKYATRHYMPVAAAAAGVLDGVANYREASSKHNAAKTKEWSCRAFYTMSLLGSRLRHLSEGVGGFYFKDRVGEELISDCLNRFRRLYYWETAAILENFSKLVNNTQINESFASFHQKLTDTSHEAYAPLNAAWADFEGWLNSGTKYDESIANFKAFSAILEYEMNRPYQFWYDRPEKLRIDKQARIAMVEAGKRISTDEAKSDFVVLVNQYIEAGTANQ